MELQEAQKIANERKREKMEERLARWVGKNKAICKMTLLFVCLCLSFHEDIGIDLYKTKKNNNNLWQYYTGREEL